MSTTKRIFQEPTSSIDSMVMNRTASIQKGNPKYGLSCQGMKKTEVQKLRH